MFNSNDDSAQDKEVMSGRGRQSGSGLSFAAVVFFLSILFFPAAIAGFGLYMFAFRKLRLRASVVVAFAALVALIDVPIILTHPFETIMQGNFLTIYFAWSILIGLVIGLWYVCKQAFNLRHDPNILSYNRWEGFRYRNTPWALFKKRFLEKELENGKAYNSDNTPMGLLSENEKIRKPRIDDNVEALKPYDPKIVYRSYKDAVTQTIISGQTGSGKSILMLSMMYNDILNGIPLTVVDFKKSADMLYFLSKWAKEQGREFYYFTNGEGTKNDFYGEQATYDPLSTGDQTSRADFILNLREWDSSADVYKQRTQEILQGLLFALIKVPHEEAPNIDWDSGNLKQLISALDVKNMWDLAEYMSRQLKAGKLNQTEELRVMNFIDNVKRIGDAKSAEGKALIEQLAGIRTVVNKLIMSSYGKWLISGSSSKHIDLLKNATSGKAPIVLFAFSAQEEPEFAKSMGQVIMSDLNRVSANKTRMGDSSLFGVYVDEFQTINPKFMADLLAKARSAGFFITIASQSLEQISAAATENSQATLQSILDVCGNYVFLKGAKQDSAETMAKIMGKTKRVIRQIQQRSSSDSLWRNFGNRRNVFISSREEDDWIISPNDFQKLRSARETDYKFSEGYFISSYEDRNTVTTAGQKINIIAQKDLIPGPSPEFKKFIADEAERELHQTYKDTALYDKPFVAPTSVEEEPELEDDTSFGEEFYEEDIQRQRQDEPTMSDQEIEDEFEKIPDDELQTTNPTPEVHSEPVIRQSNPKPIAQSAPEKPMTTFEKLQQQKKRREEHKVTDTTTKGWDEPELTSHSVSHEPKTKSFKLPKL